MLSSEFIPFAEPLRDAFRTVFHLEPERILAPNAGRKKFRIRGVLNAYNMTKCWQKDWQVVGLIDVALMLPELFRDLGVPTPSLLRSRWVEVQGQRIHSRSSPSTPAGGIPFVLVHGLVISSLYMIPLAEALAEKHEVHALDLPGFGASGAPPEILSIPMLAEVVVEWLRVSQIERCHLVGNSLGCEIAAHVANQAPRAAASLVLIGPTLDPHAFAVSTQVWRLLKDAGHEPLRLWMNWIFDFFRAGIRRSIGTTREMFRDHIENQLPRIMAPTLVVRGGTDPTVPQRAAEEMTRMLPHGELLVIDGQPHCVHYTLPDRVRAAIEHHSISRAASSQPALD